VRAGRWPSKKAGSAGSILTNTQSTAIAQIKAIGSANSSAR